MTDAAVLVNQ